MSRRASVCAVVLDGDGRVLLQRRRDNGQWALPGGAVELDETASEAIVREIEEETCCRAEVVRLTGVYSDPKRTTIRYPNGDVVQYVSTCFECRYVEGEPAPTDESADVRWFAPADAATAIWPSHANRLADALARREAAAF